VCIDCHVNLKSKADDEAHTAAAGATRQHNELRVAQQRSILYRLRLSGWTVGMHARRTCI